MGQPRIESDWCLFKIELKIKENWSGTAQGWICLISIQISIENIRKLIRGSPGLNLFDFYLILIESERKLIWDIPSRIWLISIQILIENDRKVVWDSTGQNLLDFYSKFNWKWKEISKGQPRTESDWILFRFELKIKENWSLEEAMTESAWFLFNF